MKINKKQVLLLVGMATTVVIGILLLVGMVCLIKLDTNTSLQQRFENEVVNSYRCVVKDTTINDKSSLQSDGTYILDKSNQNIVTFDIPEINLQDVSLLSSAIKGDTINVTVFEDNKELKIYLTDVVKGRSVYFMSDYEDYKDIIMIMNTLTGIIVGGLILFIVFYILCFLAYCLNRPEIKNKEVDNKNE